MDNRADKGTVVGEAPNGTALPGQIILQVSTGEVPPPPAAPDGNNNGDNSNNDNGNNNNGN